MLYLSMEKMTPPSYGRMPVRAWGQATRAAGGHLVVRFLKEYILLAVVVGGSQRTKQPYLRPRTLPMLIGGHRDSYSH